MNVLIADSSAEVRNLLTDHLERLGHRVAAFADGREACEELLDSGSHSLVFLDVAVRGMKGTDICRRIREHDEDDCIYVILLAAPDGQAALEEGMEAGADDYLAKPIEEGDLALRLRAANRGLALRAMTLEQTRSQEQVLESLGEIVIGVRADERISHWNAAAERAFGTKRAAVMGHPLVMLAGLIDWDWVEVNQSVAYCLAEGGAVIKTDLAYTNADGEPGSMDLTLNPYKSRVGDGWALMLLGRDTTEQKRLENELMRVERLQSVGQLAAGIAHEINTPIQFIQDNTSFLSDSFTRMCEVFEAYRGVLTAAKESDVAADAVSAAEAAEADAEMEYLMEDIPEAIKQSLDGIARVAKIVKAMKEFSHPGQAEKTKVDVNAVLESTATIARNEYKYIAELEMDLDPGLPTVLALEDELRQAILNMVVNAAHAIADVVGDGSGGKGQISLSTRCVNGWAEIRVSDTGTGIPEDVRDKIFDSFFTTKEVGKGTGQGLAIAHDIIVAKHEGRLAFETEMGEGTTFVIRLPVDMAQAPAGARKVAGD